MAGNRRTDLARKGMLPMDWGRAGCLTWAGPLEGLRAVGSWGAAGGGCAASGISSGSCKRMKEGCRNSQLPKSTNQALLQLGTFEKFWKKQFTLLNAESCTAEEAQQSAAWSHTQRAVPCTVKPQASKLQIIMSSLCSAAVVSACVIV